MSSRIAIYEFLSDGSQEIDLDLVRKLVIHLVLKPDPVLGSDKTRRYLTGIEISSIEWFESTRQTLITFPINVIGSPKEIIRQLVKYRRSHKVDFFSSLEKRGIQITTAEEEQQKSSIQTQKAIKWMIEGAAKGMEANKTANEALAIANEAKPEKSYIVETTIIFIVGIATGLLFLEHMFVLPIGIGIVLLVLFWGKIRKRFSRRTRDRSPSV